MLLDAPERVARFDPHHGVSPTGDFARLGGNRRDGGDPQDGSGSDLVVRPNQIAVQLNDLAVAQWISEMAGSDVPQGVAALHLIAGGRGCRPVRGLRGMRVTVPTRGLQAGSPFQRRKFCGVFHSRGAGAGAGVDGAGVESLADAVGADGRQPGGVGARGAAVDGDRDESEGEGHGCDQRTCRALEPAEASQCPGRAVAGQGGDLREQREGEQRPAHPDAGGDDPRDELAVVAGLQGRQSLTAGRQTVRDQVQDRHQDGHTHHDREQHEQRADPLAQPGQTHPQAHPCDSGRLSGEVPG